MFSNCIAPIPYWAKIDNEQDRKNAIEAYHTQKILNQTITNNNKIIHILKL